MKCPICMWKLMEEYKFKEKYKDYEYFDMPMDLEDHLDSEAHTKREIASLVALKAFEGDVLVLER